MKNILKPSLGLWTPKKMVMYASEKLYEMVHRHRAPHHVYLGGKLYLIHKHGNQYDNRGLVGANLVTQEFVEDIVDNLIAEVPAFGDYNYHISGINTSPEANTDTELTITGTTPAPVAGTQVENGVKVYQTVATINYTSTLAITAHGIINNSTKSGSLLMDHTQLTVVNVVNTDSIQFTYDLTFVAET